MTTLASAFFAIIKQLGVASKINADAAISNMLISAARAATSQSHRFFVVQARYRHYIDRMAVEYLG